MNNSPDPKALKILLDYDVFSPSSTSEADFEYAKKAGMLFNIEPQSHDIALEHAQQLRIDINKSHVTNLFLASLSTNRLEWRAGLAPYAIMQSFPNHTFKPYSLQNDYTCAICCSEPEAKVNRSFLNSGRFILGGLMGYDVFEIAFSLQQHNLLVDVQPTEKDCQIFSSILDIIENAEDNEPPAKLQKKLQKIDGFKSTEEQRRSILTTLGFCSVLETEKHKGFLHAFSNMCQVPRKSRSTYWRYPIDWWMGSDGLNKEAVKFWFGDYPQLKKFWQ